MSDLISREDLVKELNAQFAVGDITREIANDILNHIPSAELEQKWIPVAERLPKDGERVLITHRGGVSFGWYNGSYWERGAPTNHRPLETVIAWMPLPEPYRGE